MKGNYLVPKKDIWFEGQLLVDSSKVYEILEVDEKGIATTIPKGIDKDQRWWESRLFYLCANEVEVL
jgi:hypothetical protein